MFQNFGFKMSLAIRAATLQKCGVNFIFRFSLPKVSSVSGLFRVRFGVLGGVGVGSGRMDSVREKKITDISRKFHSASTWC